ncbi:HAD family hydrolase [Pyramidobacter sp. YE332]|uniref:HAD family hydrolase n=1 Tax=Pyramidobacter sp. YE332 TaxID=3068894 RepID=UPI00294B54B3|nr:HAD family hydrolase [Pyramidobacter sp. YE332]WOL39047.1 HAD family hydrolase [Pyramidobacter sp. YE332]
MLRGIVFDFDLTLVDSAAGICANLNALAAEKKLRRLQLAEVRRTIGWALADAMRSFWGDGPIEEEWLPRYRSFFEERNYAGVVPFPETVPALEKLRSRGALLGIATNRLTPLGIVRAAGLDTLCPIIVGIEGFSPKPDPAIVLEALWRMGLKAAEGVYVGDTDIDMKTAVNAGVTSVGVTTGNHGASALKESGASHVIEDLSELPELWEEIR